MHNFPNTPLKSVIERIVHRQLAANSEKIVAPKSHQNPDSWFLFVVDKKKRWSNHHVKHSKSARFLYI